MVDAKDGDIERAAAKIVNQHGLFILSIDAVANGGRGRLVDQRQHLQAGCAGAQLPHGHTESWLRTSCWFRNRCRYRAWFKPETRKKKPEIKIAKAEGVFSFLFSVFLV